MSTKSDMLRRLYVVKGRIKGAKAICPGQLPALGMRIADLLSTVTEMIEELEKVKGE